MGRNRLMDSKPYCFEPLIGCQKREGEKWSKSRTKKCGRLRGAAN